MYSPYLISHSVTTVGATTNQPDEVAASFSGGGFSNLFPQPAYQSAAVASYLSKLGTNATGLFNATGRAYPDVAAYGTRYDIVSGSAQLIVSGTSCSTPTFAAIIALINDQLLSKGKSVLGFLNPWLYSTAADQGGLNDIVEGNNLACSSGTTGFYAAEGWDPVSVVVGCGWLMMLMRPRNRSPGSAPRTLLCSRQPQVPERVAFLTRCLLYLRCYRAPFLYLYMTDLSLNTSLTELLSQTWTLLRSPYIDDNCICNHHSRMCVCTRIPLPLT